LGYRANSDGIDICNSRDVLVENCFIRTDDDLIVVKADKGQGPSQNIIAKSNVLWNPVAHALSIGAEVREPVDNVLFTDCDIIHDQGREWSMRVYQCDSALVSNIRFENIRVEEAHQLISLWIGKAIWSRDKDFGHIRNICFKNIRATGSPLNVELMGADMLHDIQKVTFEDVVLNGKAISLQGVQANGFVKNIRIGR
jgi:polygalacturonase